MNDEKEKIIAKIRKLFAMSESSSVNEAAIAAEKAQALMREYDVHTGDFMAFIEIPSTRNMPLWQQSLICAIEDLYGVILRRNTKCVYEDIYEDEYSYEDNSIYEYSLQFIGDEVYATVAYEMYTYLSNTIKRLSQAVKGRRARDSFCKGACRSVREKLENMGSDAAWIKKREQRYSQARDYTEKTLSLYVGKRETVYYSIDAAHFEKGRDAGKAISLNRQTGGIEQQRQIKS
ncbi:hypothetical protein FACS1894200_07030 [Spirochaetia bacterium]|nr:hypothetical protein FACS1894200_07030 [Spirochaetia bacterium]